MSVRRSKEGTTMLQSKIIKNEIFFTGQSENTLHVQGIQSLIYALLYYGSGGKSIDWINVPAVNIYI